MRHNLKIAVAIVFGAAVPVWAGAGLPNLASFDLGPYKAVLHGDSAQLHIGRNTLSLDLVGVSQQDQVTLRLVSPTGELIETPLKPLLVMGDPAAGHSGGHDDGHTDTVPYTTLPIANDADAHATTDAHAATDAHAPGDSHAGQALPVDHVDVTPHGHNTESTKEPIEEEPEPVCDERSSVRGSARISAAGLWLAELTIQKADRIYRSTVPLTAVPNGPNPVYLGVTGSLMFGTVVYGAVRRRFVGKGKGRP